ncbi:Sugar phosphate permease [Maridesulfovibrio ferrireducens]|uniref:Lysosomal dipeptide transporter MFSD1 n=1 Tax=Maridesulfovibrio ferrireducens TaxID=246191 RepID=A0A1G9LFI2_9BACT|nr:MFS transporter [Maridesulfovibrio ferrireducens]SDL60710.1 Sugar phosphate permease [Maridesulfovibrio ferrireducens]
MSKFLPLHSDSPPPSSSHRRWTIFAVVSFIYLLVYFQRQAPAVLALDLMRDLNLKGSSFGLLGAAFFFPYALLQLVAGPITKRLGPRRTLCIFFGLAGIGAVGFSFATNLPMALGCRFLVGVGAAMVLVPVLEILSAWFKQEEFTTMVGLLIAVAGLGVYAGAAPLSHLDHVLGWRGSFMIVGGLSLCLVAFAWLIVRDRPQIFEPERLKPLKESSSSARTLKVLSTSAFWPPVIWAFMALGVFISFGGLWGGPWLMHAHGFDKIRTGHVLSKLALGMILGGPLLGFLAERVLKSRKKVLVLAAFGLVLLTAETAFGNPMTPTGLFVWFGLLGMTTMAAAPLPLTLVRNAFADDLAPTATGLANFFFLAGGAVMQQAGGWLLETQGHTVLTGTSEHYATLFQAYFACAVVALVAALLTREE